MGRRLRREKHKIGLGLLLWASLLPSIPCRPCAIHSSISGGGRGVCVVFGGTESEKIEAIETTFDTIQVDGPDG